LAVQLGKRLFQHLSMTRVDGCLQLLSEAFSGKKQSVAFPHALLLSGRQRYAMGLP